ncbi:MAG: hypothetical protein CMH56_01240 [Myxococcales bacterium]|nr:hypothetical protein [Myxococcales bacterium]|tara:strand:+ start:43 stop:849 length:807 start_codon:yes stop_codon:yes gene_type:complete
MTAEVMSLWVMRFAPLFGFGFVGPALLSGGFQPARTRQLFLLLALPIGALSSWVGMVSFHQSYSTPARQCAVFCAILGCLLFWSVIYGTAFFAPKNEPLPYRLTIKDIKKPVLAVTSFAMGWWMTFAISDLSFGVIFQIEPLVVFACFMMLAWVRMRNQSSRVSNEDLAKVSLRMGQLIMGLSCMFLIGHEVFFPDASQRLGQFMVVGVNGSIYSLLFYIVLTLLKPLDGLSTAKGPASEMAMVQFFWTHLGLLGLHVMVVLWAVGAL